jgi:NTE family protein
MANGRRKPARERPSRRRLSLALQGGGSHGAYTWGVLDRLVEEPNLVIDAVSGTSAGAMNGALLVDGWSRGGREGAQHALRTFWHEVSKAGDAVFNPWRYVDAWPALRNLASAWSEALARLWSPYDNPLYRNPLSSIVEAAIDFESLARCRKPRLFVCATNVLTNERRVFSGAELGAEALLASACLPTQFQAVEIKGEYYWDGGYTGNPAIEPLLAYCDDVLIVEVNALQRTELPTKAADIFNRLNEISFNTSLVQELHVIDTMNKLIANGSLVDPKYRQIRIHCIEADRAMTSLGADSKTDTNWDFLRHLHALGRAGAQRWLEDSFSAVGKRSSVDVDGRFCALARGRERVSHVPGMA